MTNELIRNVIIKIRPNMTHYMDLNDHEYLSYALVKPVNLADIKIRVSIQRMYDRTVRIQNLNHRKTAVVSLFISQEYRSV